MDTKIVSKASWRHIICCIVLLLLFVLTIGIHINAEGTSGVKIADNSASDTIPLNNKDQVLFISADEMVGPKEAQTVKPRKLDSYLATYSNELNFFSKAFQVNYDDIVEDLTNRYDEANGEFNETNVGFLTDSNGEIKTFSSVEYGMVEYFYNFVKKHPKKVNNKRVPYTGNAEYVENLIIYYTTHIYTNVDTTTALSIGAAGSGYYKVKYMLACNNVYGGMGYNGLIKHKNIEYGVLSYVRMLSRSYYGKGLDTPAKIGRVYCPTTDSNGNKIASPHWINLVNTAKNKYSKYNMEISLTNLLGE